MSLRIYNTLTRMKESFETIEPGKVRLYVCGPTVYDSAHVGHAMSSIVFDILRRYLEYKGYQVRHVMNYTDVDDKVIKRAGALGVEPSRLAERYIDEYDRHLRELNILNPHVKPRVSSEMETIVQLVQALIEKGYAYAVDGDVYFRVSKDADYGKLSRRKLEDMRAGYRLEVDERKEDPADFALWKASKEGEPAWDSPWGPGRPGWHIECSAMALRHLGEQIDIHGGGNELIFPHHENEIAQTESLTGKPFARYWVHNGLLQFAGDKMSKSIGNIITVDEFLSKYDANVLRMMILNGHYRAPLVYTDEVLEQAGKGFERLKGALRPVSPSPRPDPSIAIELRQKALGLRPAFERAMDDDFNTPTAMGEIFELVRVINQARDAGVDEDELQQAQNEVRKFTGLLGLRLDGDQDLQRDIAPFIDLLIEVRQALRDAKQWDLADKIRDRLLDHHIALEDTKTGTLWRFYSSNRE
jgi:cysteinyl-tRNA synthetase